MPYSAGKEGEGGGGRAAIGRAADTGRARHVAAPPCALTHPSLPAAAEASRRKRTSERHRAGVGGKGCKRGLSRKGGGGGWASWAGWRAVGRQRSAAVQPRPPLAGGDAPCATLYTWAAGSGRVAGAGKHALLSWLKCGAGGARSPLLSQAPQLLPDCRARVSIMAAPFSHACRTCSCVRWLQARSISIAAVRAGSERGGTSAAGGVISARAGLLAAAAGQQRWGWPAALQAELPGLVLG